jgi:hypothetical protein
MAFTYQQSNATDYDQIIFFNQVWFECKKVKVYYFV